MDKPYKHPRSHLFTVQVWQEELGQDQSEWRGKVQLITDGSVRYFREWERLVPLLVTMLSELETLSEPNSKALGSLVGRSECTASKEGMTDENQGK